MGCSSSRLDREEEMPAGLRPFRPRIEELKRRRRARYAIVVPTTDLPVMKPVENDNDESSGGALTSELPGSPSFRIFFENTTSTWDSADEDSVKVIQDIKNAKLAMAKKNASSNEELPKNTHGRESSNESLASNTSSEEQDTKPLKKERARRFKALTKAPSRAYSFLTDRNRGGHSCACHSHDSPRFRTGKSS